MRTIIAGGRDITNMEYLWQALRLWPHPITVVVSGKARGADKLGENYAKLCGIPVDPYPADWDNLGKRAGFVRNQQMADNAQALIALWDGHSSGTKHMIDCATKSGLLILVHKVVL